MAYSHSNLQGSQTEMHCSDLPRSVLTMQVCLDADLRVCAMQEERIRTKDQQISQLHRDIQDQKYSNDQIFHGVCGCFQRGKIAHSMAVCMHVCARARLTRVQIRARAHTHAHTHTHTFMRCLRRNIAEKGRERRDKRRPKADLLRA